jgi:siroheme synthase
MLMGVERLGSITREMLNHGVREDLPVALVRWATTDGGNSPELSEYRRTGRRQRL